MAGKIDVVFLRSRGYMVKSEEEAQTFLLGLGQRGDLYSYICDRDKSMKSSVQDLHNPDA